MDTLINPNSSLRSRRLVVVSNRVPARSSSPGGLAVAMADALSGRECLWFGWDGERGASQSGGLSLIEEGSMTYGLVEIGEDDFVGYYEGYANQTLWPAFHYRLDLSDFEQDAFDAYLRVNQLFARELAPLLRPDDIVWIHDYHLLAVPRELRALGVSNPVGFFSHIPFPSPEIFQAIPGREEIIDGLLSADLVGFQSNRDRENFERYVCGHMNGYWMPDGRVAARGKTVRSMAFPIGIDVDTFRTTASDAQQSKRVQRLAGHFENRDLIVGVDRMDYSKGLIERIDAFDDLMTSSPELREKASLVQVAPVSRGNVEAYARLREQLEQRVGHVNGKHASLDWTPIQFIASPVPRDEIAGLLRVARVGLVTPLRDGMNMVAKEFVAAQDPQDPGVLIISEFAGAAEQMREALVINPHNSSEQADAIRRALSMPLPERQERHAALLKTIKNYDSRWWCSAFLEELTATTTQDSSSIAAAIGNHFGRTEDEARG